jgi:hypothetical protein
MIEWHQDESSELEDFIKSLSGKKKKKYQRWKQES